jgi:hypothetical protein
VEIQLYGLYQADQPIYFGITSEENRFGRHRTAAKNGIHWNAGLQAAFSVKPTPEFRVLAICPDKEYAGTLEQGMIFAYGRKIDGGVLCNIAGGGQGPDRALMSRPEFRKRNKLAQIKSYAENPERRLIASRGGRAANLNPASNEIRSSASREMNVRTWADPVVRARRVAAMKGKKHVRNSIGEQS